jgi:hypothetical protein
VQQLAQADRLRRTAADVEGLAGDFVDVARRAPLQPPLIFTSTNKVYGGLG